MTSVYGVSSVSIAPEAKTDEQLRASIDSMYPPNQIPGENTREKTPEEMQAMGDAAVEGYHKYAEPLVDSQGRRGYLVQVFTSNEAKIWENFLGAGYTEDRVRMLRAAIDAGLESDGIEFRQGDRVGTIVQPKPKPAPGEPKSVRQPGEPSERAAASYFVPEDVLPVGTHPSEVMAAVTERMDGYVTRALGIVRKDRAEVAAARKDRKANLTEVFETQASNKAYAFTFATEQEDEKREQRAEKWNDRLTRIPDGVRER